MTNPENGDMSPKRLIFFIDREENKTTFCVQGLLPCGALGKDHEGRWDRRLNDAEVESLKKRFLDWEILGGDFQ